MQHSCEKPEDCSSVCSNCTTSNCVDNFCQCLTCENKDAVESRSIGKPQKTCSVARECEEMCKGCVKVGCRFGNCQCGKCEDPAATEVSIGSTTDAVTESGRAGVPEVEESSTVSVDIFQLKPSNQTRDDVTVRGRCVPKRCNHACWERQCSKWNCVDDRCDCDGCPDDMAVVVRNSDGKPGKPEDSNKYEIIF